MIDWRPSTWGDEISLEYGKGIRGYADADGPVRVFGTNGPVGWTDEPLTEGPGVILGRKGAYRGIHYSPDSFFVIDTAYFAKPKHEMNMRWLYYAMIHHQLGSIDDGSPIPSTTRAAVYPRELMVPSVAEQKAIAEVLGALDDKIEQNHRTAAKLEEFARATFKAWFVDFEPVHAKTAGAASFPGMPAEAFEALPSIFLDSPLGPIPEGWEVKPLDEVASFLNGLALQKYPPREDGSDLPVIKIAQLRKGSTEGAAAANGTMDDKYKVKDGDLLFSWSGTLEVVFWFGGPGALNQHLFKVTSDKFPAWCVFEWIRHHLEEFRLIASSKATTMGHIKRSHLKQALVAVPTDSFLQVADKEISPLFDVHANLHLESRHLVRLRDYLLPQLLSGAVRVRSQK